MPRSANLLVLLDSSHVNIVCDGVPICTGVLLAFDDQYRIVMDGDSFTFDDSDVLGVTLRGHGPAQCPNEIRVDNNVTRFPCAPRAQEFAPISDDATAEATTPNRSGHGHDIQS